MGIECLNTRFPGSNYPAMYGIQREATKKMCLKTIKFINVHMEIILYFNGSKARESCEKRSY